MSRASMTPGPWEFTPPGQRESGALIRSSRGAIVAEVWPACATGARQTANARAIAALPELVEALRQIANDWPHDTPAIPANHARKLARLALAKLEVQS